MKPTPRLREAIDALYSRGTANSESYTRLLLQCVRSNDVVQAKRLQTHMDLHLYQPTDTFLQNRLLHLYAKSGNLSDARDLFDKMSRRDVFSWNAMLSAYSKSGNVEDLRAVFDQMSVHDAVSYNTFTPFSPGNCRFFWNGCSSQALEFFVRMQEEGFESTDYTHVSVLHACSQLLDIKRGKQIHGRIVATSLGESVFVWNALTNMYAKCGALDQARWLFDRMVNKNVVSWNSMISGYLQNGQPETCTKLFCEMQSSGLMPDQVTISNILSAYFQCGYIDEACKTFREIKEKDKVCWTTMMVGCAQNGKEEDALLLFREMLLENVRPDNFTISSVVSSCARLASLCQGQAVHGKAVIFGVDHDLLVSSALVDMYSKCGETADAWIVFKRMLTRNVISWNSMILGYAQNGKDLEALALYEEMLHENLKPDNITFVGVLSACMHAGLVERGQGYFYSISKIHGMNPTFDHYSCMINLLGRAGYMDKAVDLIKTRHLFELDPHNAGPYIMLSNIYAACGRWKDVAAVRSLMKNNKIKKFAAYSWIEIDNQVHKFVAEDRTHSETEQIYEELNRLIKKLQESGFTPDTNLVLHDVVEEEKFDSICYHSEKLALAFWLIKKPHGRTPIRIMKNIRVCGDCHVFMKFVSKIIRRPIILRDINRFHHFIEGRCSCKDS
ncbi:Pentatricopeptide repeat-containing protein [Vitis vinifera]|uniref:Pentatricopeptide repeat-containing protein n=1 Tax=Vitis vinifera TaxID=29760 RepID=A0A438DRX6_VITVI|nr:Pentatricopeptide repeat-containing protein [Vitis vinifera]